MMKYVAISRQIRQAIEQRQKAEQENAKARLQPLRNSISKDRSANPESR